MSKDTKEKPNGLPAGTAAPEGSPSPAKAGGSIPPTMITPDVYLRHADLEPAPGNRTGRSGMDHKSIRELAESIASQGIVQSLVVRPHPDAAKKGKYQIVCGERRWSACDPANSFIEQPTRDAIAAFPGIRCQVRPCSDTDALEIRTIENLQREGIHELEEAANYKQMLDLRDAAGVPRYHWESLAARIGKSAAFVRARVKLLAMPDLAKKALLSGKLSASVALLLCRIPDAKSAHKATCEVLDRAGGKEEHALNKDVEPMSYRHAMQHIGEKYMKRLKGQPFDQTAADLVPLYDADGKPLAAADAGSGARAGGGDCGSCPFRTGNMGGLFPDVQSADVCTNLPCLKKKCDAHQKREAAKFAEKGQTLLKPKQAERVLNYAGTALSDQAREQYVPLNEKIPGKKVTYGELLEKQGVEHEVVVAKGAKTVPLAPLNDAVVKALNDAGVECEKPAADLTAAERAQREADRATRQSLVADVTKAYLAAMSKAIRTHNYEVEVRAVVLVALLDNYDGPTLTVKEARKLDDREAFARLFEAHMEYRPFNHQGELYPDAVKLAANFDVDLKALLKDAEAAAKAKATAESASASKADKKKS